MSQFPVHSIDGPVCNNQNAFESTSTTLKHLKKLAISRRVLAEQHVAVMGRYGHVQPAQRC